jgi:hypothetical protein
MDSYTTHLLQRIEEKLDFIINKTDFCLKDLIKEEDKDQFYFHWYQDIKPRSSLDVIK